MTGNSNKRFVAILLTIMMVLEMLPVNALAAGWRGVTYSSRMSGSTYHTVTFKANDTVVATQYVEAGATVVLPESPTVEGKSFTGWVDSNGKPVTAKTTVSGDMTVTAVFEDISVFTVKVQYVLADDPTVEVAEPVVRQYFKSYNTADSEEGCFDVSSDEIDSPAVVSYQEKNYYPNQTKVTVEPDTLTQAETVYTVTYASANTQYEIRHYIMQKVTAEDGSISFTKEGATEVETERETGLVGADGAQIYPAAKTFEGLSFVEAEPVTLDKSAAENIARVYYQPQIVTLTYQSMGGSYVDPKSTYSGESMDVYTEDSQTVEGDPVLSCGKEEHTHTYNNYWNNKYYGGCYPWNGGKNPTCGKTAHSHSDDCYSASSTTVTTLNPAPTRQGYTFAGWYLDAACTQEAPATIDPMMANTTVYAKWEASTANYTVVYLKENVEGGFDYISSSVKSANVGDRVTGSDGAGSFTNSKYYHYDSSMSTSATVKADGSTVVQAKYMLNTYTLKFDIDKDGAKITIGGSEYEGSEYSFTAKLGEDISAKWPTANHISGTSSTFYGWDPEHTNTQYVSKRFNLTPEMLKSTTNGSTTTYTAIWKSGTKVILHYMLQNADDDGYTDSDKYRQEAYTTGGFSAKEIDGFTNTKEEEKTENGVTNYYFYYTRKTYQIEYFYASTKLATKTGIRFEKDINTSDYNLVYTPESVGLDADYSFDGWFVDPECTNAFTFDKMPANNLVLYAKFTPPEKDVELKYNYDEISNTLTVTKGTVAEIPTPTREGYTFLGWFTEPEGGERFDTNKPITEDVTLYAHWTMNALSYTVKYVDESGKELAPAKTVTNTTFVLGQQVTETALSIKGYRADTAEKSTYLQLMPENNVITFVYSERSASSYKVEYIIQGTNTKVQDDKTVNVGAEVERVTETAPANVVYNGVTYYPTVAVQSLVIGADTSSNVITFEYLPYRSVTVNVQFFYGTGDDYSTYVENPGFATPVTARVGDTVLASSYNDNTHTQNGTYKLVEADPSSALTINSGMVNTEQTLKLYFELDEAGYTINHYLEGTTTKVAESETGKAKIGSIVTAKASANLYDDYKTAAFSRFSPDSGSIKVVKDDAANVITVYYKIPLTIAANSANHTYDGQPKTVADANGDEYTVSGLLSGDAIATAIDVTYGDDNAQSKTAVGTYTANLGKTADKITVTKDGSEVSYYAISVSDGMLTISQANTLTVSANNASKTYDGEPLRVTATSNGGDGTTISYSTDGGKTWSTDVPSITHAGSVTVMVKAENPNYSNVPEATYTLTVNPAELTVTTPDASKVYDGDPLTKAGSISGFVKEETATFATTGTQTEVGSSKNTYSITWDGTAKATDYTISESVGTLTVTENADEIVVTTTGGTFTYDGNAHGATVSVSTLPKGYTLETATSSATATHVTKDPVPATCDTLVIRNAAGEDVTSKLNIKYVDGSITITPATLTVTTPDASKVYDGDPLTAAGSISGFVKEETATFATTGTQTEVGNSKNTYSITWEGSTATESDYTVSATVGTLTVTENADEIVVTTTGGEFTYDGEAHGATVSVSTLPKGYTLETATSNDTATHVAEGTVTANCDTLVIKNAQGVDVTTRLNIRYVNGSITITPRPVTLTSATDRKPYDEKPLTNGTVTVSGDGFIDGEGATYDVTGSQTYIGSSDNEFTYTLNEGTEAENYAIETVFGTLTVEGISPVQPEKTTPEVESDYALGDKIPFDIRVKNIMDKELTNVTVTDPTAEILNGAGYTVAGNVATIASMQPGEVVVVKAQHTVTEEDILKGTYGNTATVTVDDDEMNVSASTDDIDDPNGQLTVIKETTSEPANGETYALGETITYEITVKNEGNVTISGIVVTDELTGDEWEIESLVPGETSTVFTAAHEVTEADILKGEVLNVATATGKTPEDKDPEVIPGETTDETDDPNGQLTVIKETTSEPANGETYALGETITYEITVKNEGNVTISGIVVTDELTGDEWEIESLVPGETSTVFTAAHEVTEADILKGEVLNVATATGKTPEDKDPEVIPGETTDKTDPPAPSFKLTKEITNSDGKPFGFNEEIRYKVTFHNTGNVSLMETKIEDVAGANGTAKRFDLGTVGIGDEVSFEYAYTVQDGDLRPVYEADGVTAAKHIVTNTATVTTVPASAKEGDLPMTGTASADHEVAQWYHAIFVDTRTNEVVRFINVPYGGSIELPDAPEHRGYTFLGWRYPVLDNITFNQVVYAYYERDAETIYDARIPLAGGYISNVGDTFD